MADEWLVFLAFSGGGPQVAALSYGGLGKLTQTTFHKTVVSGVCSMTWMRSRFF